MEMTRKIAIVFLMSFIYCIIALRNEVTDPLQLIRLSLQMQIGGFFGGVATVLGHGFGSYLISKFKKR